MSTLPKSRNCYENFMMNAIEESLSTLGEQSKDLIYKYLAQSHCLEKEQIPCSIEVFSQALENLLGNGAKFLEFLIMKRFNEKIGNIFKLEESEICNYMMSATEFSKKIIELGESDKKEQLPSNKETSQSSVKGRF